MKLSQPQVLEMKKNKDQQLYRMLDEAKVKQFLLDNPGFLTNNPELLSHIELKHAEKDTLSLVERQVKTLREKNSQLQGQQIEMLQTAHANEQLLKLCNQLMLNLISSDSLEQFTNDLDSHIKTLFDLDAVALLLVGNYAETSVVKTYNHADNINSELSCQFPDNQPLCGRLNQQTRQVLFGDFNSDLKSCALIPLGKGCDKGLLALASTEVTRFSPEMGTLFVELIAKFVIARVASYERN